jgi:hypothetical protein
LCEKFVVVASVQRRVLVAEVYRVQLIYGTRLINFHFDTSLTNITERTICLYHVEYLEKREFEAFASIQILERATTLSKEWKIAQVIKRGNGITHSSDEELALQPFTGGQKCHKTVTS